MVKGWVGAAGRGFVGAAPLFEPAPLPGNWAYPDVPGMQPLLDATDLTSNPPSGFNRGAGNWAYAHEPGTEPLLDQGPITLPKGSVVRWRFPLIGKEIRLEYWQWDLLGPIPFRYEVYSGYAEDDYPADFVAFPFMSRLIMANIRDAPAYLILTYDGETEQPERRFDLGFARLEAAVGFKIRNAEPGISCQYQIIPML